MAQESDLDRRFDMIGPWKSWGLRENLNAQFRGLARLLNRLPEGREKSKSLNRLEEAMMWARESLDH